MKFIAAREIRINPGEVWKRLKPDEPLVITSNGKPIAFLAGLDAATMEETWDDWKHVRFLKALRASQRTAARSGSNSLSMEDIEKIISSARRDRNRRR